MNHRRAAIPTLLLLLPAFGALASANPGIVIRTLSAGAARAEQRDRDVDQVALSAQEGAISRLEALLDRHRGGSQEPILLSRLAELQRRRAALVFRIERGDIRRDARKSGPYRHAMARTVGTLDLLISRFPGYPEIAHAYFLRGQCHEELEEVAEATSDYLHLVQHFPDSDEAPSAYMSLAEFAINANNHPLAISYLREIEKRPEDPHYPFALYKLAWSYYNLKDIARALSYAETQIRFYDERGRARAADGLAPESAEDLSSDAALRENTLVDIPVFYFQGIEDKQEGYSVNEALDYFRREENGPLLGKMAVRFAKLLRSRDMDEDLVRWKDRFLASGSPDALRPEAIELLLLTYEHQLNQRQYDRLVESARDLVRLYQLRHGQLESLGRAQKLLLDTAGSLQSLIVRNPESGRARALSVILASVYDSFTRIVREEDPRISQAHYNLAETLYAIRDFEGSVTHYRWVVDHGKGDDKLLSGRVGDADLKAIAARYESLRERHLIPAELKARPCRLSRDPAKIPASPGRRVDPALGEWIGWVDARTSRTRSAAERKEIENFRFEADRALYAQGDLPTAVARLHAFALSSPRSEYAIPSASLVLDSAIAAEDWDGALALTDELSRIPAWKGSPFSRRLAEVAGDCLYKKMEAGFQAKDYAGTLRSVDAFLEKYPSSPRVPDCLSLGGAAALASHQEDKALSYLSSLIQSPRAGPRAGEALLARAGMEESHHLYPAATRDYRSFLRLPRTLLPEKFQSDPKRLIPLRRKILLLGWLTGDPALLRALVEDPSICSPELKSECDPFEAFSALARAGSSSSASPDRSSTITAFNQARGMGAGPARTLWALLALQGCTHLGFRDRNLTLRWVASGYPGLDPLMRIAVLPYLNSQVPRAFRLNRLALKDVAPLRASPRYLAHRVDSIHELENAGAKVMELPWARIRAEILNETAAVYLDLSRDLSNIPAPKSLGAREAAAYQDTLRRIVMPFEEKGEEIRSRAFEIASRFAIEDDSFQDIAEPFFKENPSQARKLRGQPIGPQPPATLPADLPFLRLDLQYTSELGKLPGSLPDLYPAWVQSLREGNWALATMLLQEAREKRLLGEGELDLLRAISLSLAGARAEALDLLFSSRGQLNGKLKSLVTLTLAHYYAGSLAKEKADALYREIELTPPPGSTKTCSAKDPPRGGLSR